MIIVKNLVKKFGDRVIIRDFSYHFPKNTNIGIVGANGAGKTTLLNILTGLEEYDDGEVIIPKDCALGYLPQSPNKNPQETILDECISGHATLCKLQQKLHQALKDISENYSDELYEKYEKIEAEFSDSGGYALEAKAKGVLTGLGFAASQFDKSPLILSGGWRMRLELARLLMNEPNFLILDEPTNHLDLPSLTWLEGYLKSFCGTLLFVSHDREFLNNLSDQIIHVANGNVNVYNGNFEDFVEQREMRSEYAQKQKDALKKQQNHLQEFVDRFRYKSSKAKQAQSKLKIIERLKQLEERIDVEETDQQPVFKMTVENQSAKVVLDLKNVAIGYNGITLNKNIDLRIIRGNKIAIIGSNGIGKSTLLKTIIREIPLISGEMQLGNNVSIGYYAQNQLDVLDPELDVLENIMTLTKDINQQQVRAILGCLLISKNDVKKPISVLSGGEKSKVAIAVLLAQKSNFLIFDEPTNHLDMSSTEALSNALNEYNGTVLVVSHNRSFINSFATHIFSMDEKKCFYKE